MLRIRDIALASLAVACSDMSAVVGGACAEGYVREADECVPVSSVSIDSGSPVGDDGGPPTSTDGSLATRDVAKPPSNNDNNSTIGPGIVCVAPEVQCGDACVDLSSDPTNCGACGKVCPSNSCVSGQCVGSAPGHVVVVGHDFASAPTAFSSQARVLANAVLMPASNPLRVMSYEQYASAAAVQNAESLVSAEAKQLGRSVTFVATASAQTVSSSIDVTSYDVLLVHDQSKAPSGTLGTIGSTWASDGNVTSFLHAGGVVVVLTGGTGVAEMPALATNAQLLSIASQSVVTGSLGVLAPADAVGSGVVSPYFPKPSTVTLDAEANGGDVTWVVAQNGSPVVVHKIMP